LHASGYLLKPVDREELEEEIRYAMAQKPTQVMTSSVVAHTFGEFDLYADGRPVVFQRSKAKELLAFLIDRQGGSVTKKVIFATLWEDDAYDRSKQKYLDIIIRSMFDTLKEYSIEDIVERQRGALRIRPEKIDCDMYLFFEGDSEAVNSYRGRYMSAYTWAVFSEARITQKKQ
jgi:two-component SAPR family response regulator